LKNILQYIKNLFPSHLRLLLYIFAYLIAFFTFLRLILLLIHINELINVPLLVIFEALLIGIRFDASISGYIIIIPFLLLSLIHFLPWKLKWISLGSIIYINILSCIALIIAIVNIPFFGHYHFPITASIFDWSDQPIFITGMLFRTWSYYPFIILLLAICGCFILLVIRKYNSIEKSIESKTPRHFWSTITSIAIFIFSLALVILIMRGRISEKSPIRWGTAYFSQYPFPNQLALNPVFTFVQSWTERNELKNKELALIEYEQALKNVRHYFRLPEKQIYDSPIARKIIAQGHPSNQNVILVLMENMAAWKMRRYGNQDNLTPFLDSLAEQSIVFDQFYSSGIHTSNGIYSTLFGLPTLLQRHPMKPTESIQPYTGIAYTLKKDGYQTAYFCTHDAEFDNMAGFLSNNGFQQIVSEKDYPKEKIKSTLGVPDHVLFEEALPRLRQFSMKSKPFFAAFLTASDHIPHIIPDGIQFQPHSNEMNKKIVEYADWSIKHFLELAQKESWYNNTIFVFTADHGNARDSQYGMTLSFHHTPCIIFIPQSIQSKQKLNTLGTQLDIYPTIMGLLNVSYINNTFGRDILHEQYPFVFFNSDEKAGCLSDKFYLVLEQDGHESLFEYRQADNIDYRSTFLTTSDSMSTYLRSMYQTAQWMIKNRKVGEPKERHK